MEVLQQLYISIYSAVLYTIKSEVVNSTSRLVGLLYTVILLLYKAAALLVKGAFSVYWQ